MRILTVEDDDRIAEALSDQNYVVEIATDGQAAWEFIETLTYELILLDVMLLKLDGISLCWQVRSHGYLMPILLLTARDPNTE